MKKAEANKKVGSFSCFFGKLRVSFSNKGNIEAK